MNVFKELEQRIKKGDVLPQIRYFDGIKQFCTPSGQYKADTYKAALVLYLQDKSRK